MRSSWIESLGPGFHPNPPADAAAIARVEADLSATLPADHKAFLRASNGGRGEFANALVYLHSTADLVAPFRIKSMREFRPHFVEIGTDGGGEMLAFDMRDASGRIVLLPFVGGEEDAIGRAPNFRALLEALGRGESLFPAPT
jgi:hypothetical protein